MKEFTLPTEKSKPKANLKDYLILIFGLPKIGKTTLAAQFEDPLFLMFEPSGKALELYQLPMKSWERFKETISLLKKDAKYKTVVIDSVGPAYDACMAYICKGLGVEHPSEAPFGKAWNGISQEFGSCFNQLGLTGKGIVITAHAISKDIEKPNGTIQEMMAPSVPKQAMDWISRNIDLQAYYYFGANGKRYLRVKGNDNVVAGSRIDGHFKNISRIYAGNSPQEAYKNLILGFENKEVKGE